MNLASSRSLLRVPTLRHALGRARETHQQLEKDFGSWGRKVVETRKPKRPKAAEIFHEVEVGGRRFFGAVYHNDLYLADEFERSTYIGPTEIYQLTEGPVHEVRYRGPGWYLCKYDPRQVKISLDGFSDEEARLLAAEFGVDGAGFRGDFYGSPAADGLAEWVRNNPGAARRRGPKAIYLKNWHLGSIRDGGSPALDPPDGVRAK